MSEKRLPCIPLRNITVLPNTSINIDVKRPFSLKALEKALENGDEIYVVQQKQSGVQKPEAEDLYEVGTVVRIVEKFRMPDKSVKVILEGKKSARHTSFGLDEDCYYADVEELEYYTSSEGELEVVIDLFNEEVRELFEESEKYPDEIVKEIRNEKNDDVRLNMYAQLILSVDNETFIQFENRVDRYTYVIAKIRDEKKIVEVQRSIEKSINEKMQNAHRDYILREQKKAIEEELDGGDEDDEIEELHRKIDELAASDEIKKKLHKEIVKMVRMSPSTPEYSITRNYLDFVIELPWGKLSEDREDLNEVKKILDEDHYGLEKVKDRIMEYLAVRILTKGEGKGTILCLVGPPGVGKTSIAKSIARALNKEYIQMSLGGIHDEAEIRGHRKTYVGAMPGRILSSLHKAKTNNPLFLLDEIDKITSDLKGDPSSALLEVLDPQQNSEFRDNYLEIPYDLSKVMFITTANTLDTIQQALLDRMEVINMSGYTEYEKLNIAKNYLVRKQKKENGVENVDFTDGAILEIIRKYTREAGVRNLERSIGNICRKIAREIVEKSKGDVRFKITANNIGKYLGVEQYRDAEIENGVGVCTGLAWTSVGGETLSIEVSIVVGKGEIILTGHLGDVMKESARTAVTVVKSRAKEFGIPVDYFEKHDIHIHVPEGAVPKDGPSAGITMTTAIMSAVTGKSVNKGLAMTGEITLRGNVLPIGGLKEKSLAAQRLGVKKILIPEDNVKDLVDVPEIVKKNVEFVAVNNIDQVFNLSYGG